MQHLGLADLPHRNYRPKLLQGTYKSHSVPCFCVLLLNAFVEATFCAHTLTYMVDNVFDYSMSGRENLTTLNCPHNAKKLKQNSSTSRTIWVFYLCSTQWQCLLRRSLEENYMRRTSYKTIRLICFD